MPAVMAYRSGDKRQALEIFGHNILGPDWQTVIERYVPGAIEQAKSDVDTFFQELSSMQEWHFGSRQAAMIHQPVLSVIGAGNDLFMTEGRDLLHSWFPQTEDFDAPTSHLLQMQDPQSVAHALVEFFSRHPMT